MPTRLVDEGHVMRPRVKPEHEPFRLVDGRIRIGGSVYGIGAEIEDAEGIVWMLLKSFDGTRPLGVIIEGTQQEFPGYSVEQVRELAGELIASGYVEDASALPPAELSQREQERYDRNLAFHRWVDLTPHRTAWDVQVTLKRARVLVVGLGGTGATAAYSLAASGVGRIHCLDSDHIELSNLTRQVMYTENDIGKPKVDVAVERLRRVNSDVEISGERRRIRDASDLAELMANYDVLALCADEPRGSGGIRFWANRACLKLRRPWVGGGYHGPRVSVGAFLPDGPCYECFEARERERQSQVTPGADKSADFLVRLGGPGATAVSAGISGHLVAHAVIAIIAGAPAFPGNSLFSVNLVALDDPGVTRYARVPGCKACGGYQKADSR